MEEKNAVKLYVYDISASDFDSEKISLVEEKRRENLLTGKNYLYRLRSLYAGLLLRHALKLEGYDVKDPLNVEYGEHGKPFVRGAKHFSISHSGNLVVVGISENEVGVDVEIKQNKIYSNIIDKTLTEKERAEYYSLEGLDRSVYFLKKWVRKESYVKYLGTGFDIYPCKISDEDAMHSDGEINYKNYKYFYSVCSAMPAEVSIVYVKRLK